MDHYVEFVCPYCNSKNLQSFPKDGFIEGYKTVHCDCCREPITLYTSLQLNVLAIYELKHETLSSKI